MTRGNDIRRKAPALTAGLMLAAVMLSSEGWAQDLSYPLYIGNAQAIQDELGRNLAGAATLQLTLCDRVEVLSSINGLIYPPDSQGHPDARNVLIPDGLTVIGNQTAIGLTNSGLFSLSLNTNKPLPGATLFVRAFNAPTREAASFYGDSALFTIGADLVYVVTITNMQPLNPFDSDGDGLNDSWEKSLGSDANLGDSDGDGLNDGDEQRAGTDPTDRESRFVMAWLSSGVGTDAVIAWESVPGKKYQVEYSNDPLTSEPVFENASAVITASSPITEVTVAGGFLNQEGHYRVRLVED